MRSRARQERRLEAEQDTVGARRAERLEQEKLGAHSNLEVILPRAKRAENLERRQQKAAAAKEHSYSEKPRRIARPGKPLKRP